MRIAAITPFILANFATAIYVPLREYAGRSFFDRWDYWGNVDNTTWGNVTYLDRSNAEQRRLTYVNDAGRAIIRVDNTTNITPATLVNRPSVRITTQDTYGVGTVWIIDAAHIPYGCSVWPSFWSLGVGKEWPEAGEIDVIEGINLLGNNQMALHTKDPGPQGACVQAPNPGQSGTTLEGDCSQDRGCLVRETKPNSFGRGFAQAGGGVFAVQMDISGIYIWFWPRAQVPDVIKNASPTTNIDAAAFGMPSASYPAAGCNVTEFFGPQKLILLTTLCGTWAGVPDIYASTCPGNCVADNIIGAGSPRYDTAYWEINYLRTYIAEDLAQLSSASSPSSTAQSSGSSTRTSAAAGTSGPTQGTSTTNSNSAISQLSGQRKMVIALAGLSTLAAVAITSSFM